MNILVSACLLGVECRYDGKGYADERVLKLGEKHNLIPVCPEQLGGMTTPREPSEQRNGKVVSCTGEDVTACFEKGADETLRLAELLHCSCALMKSKSPSCGCGRIYDGTFTGCLAKGNGVAVQKLLDNGIQVITEDNLNELEL